MTDRDTICGNLAHVRERMATAAARAGRSVDETILVAVTKTVDIPQATAIFEVGAHHLGENRVQELSRKQAAMGHLDARWHLSGKLQTNKAKKVVGKVALIHSVDSLRLAEMIGEIASKRSVTQDILLQVNVSGEDTKSGFTPSELAANLPVIAAIPGVRVAGLMTMAPFLDDPEEVRPVFRALRELRDRHRTERPSLEHLSMGMTNDFEVAIEEGATLIRIGTALFKE